MQIHSHPDIFIKTYRKQEDIRKLFETCKIKRYRFEQWKKTPVTVKSGDQDIRQRKDQEKKRS